MLTLINNKAFSKSLKIALHNTIRNHPIEDVIVFFEPPVAAYDNTSKGGKMTLNRFCINEETAFESCGVFYLEQTELWSYEFKSKSYFDLSKGKGESF